MLFGRQGPAATLRQHCPQMTQRRCILYEAENVGIGEKEVEARLLLLLREMRAYMEALAAKKQY